MNWTGVYGFGSQLKFKLQLSAAQEKPWRAESKDVNGSKNFKPLLSAPQREQKAEGEFKWNKKF